MVRVEKINQREQNISSSEINIIQQKKQRRELLSEMISIADKTPHDAKIDFDCGLGLTKYYEKMKTDLLNKHQQLFSNYQQSELESYNRSNLTLILADLRKNIILIDSIWVNDSREMTYYQKISLTTCQHLLAWEN